MKTGLNYLCHAFKSAPTQKGKFLLTPLSPSPPPSSLIKCTSQCFFIRYVSLSLPVWTSRFYINLYYFPPSIHGEYSPLLRLTFYYSVFTRDFFFVKAEAIYVSGKSNCGKLEIEKKTFIVLLKTVSIQRRK